MDGMGPQNQYPWNQRGNSTLSNHLLEWIQTMVQYNPATETNQHLVGGWATHLENMLVKVGIISPGIGLKKDYVKPPPRIWYTEQKIDPPSGKLEIYFGYWKTPSTFLWRVKPSAVFVTFRWWYLDVPGS